MKILYKGYIIISISQKNNMSIAQYIVKEEMTSKDYYEYTNKNNHDIKIWKPLNRPFKMKYELSNKKLNYVFRYKNNSIRFVTNLKYNTDFAEMVNDIENKVKMSLQNVEEYSYDRNMVYEDNLTIWINNVQKNEKDFFKNPTKILLENEHMYFEDMSDFHSYIKNKLGTFVIDIYFEVELNTSINKWRLLPKVFSIDFTKEPKMDMTVQSFNQMTKEEQKEILKEFIETSINADINKEMKIPSFLFKSLYFAFPTIRFAEDASVVRGKKFEPSLWLGKKGKYDENSNAKESLIMLMTDELDLFMNNIRDILELYLPEFHNVLTKKMKGNGFNIKLGKKDNLVIKMPVTEHNEVEVVVNEDEEEEIVLVQDGLKVKSLTVKQPSVREEDENLWETLPSKLNYELLYPKICFNKLWYDDKEKKLVLQMCLSKYFTFNSSQKEEVYYSV